MIKQSIQASDFGKKPYAAPQMEMFRVETSNMICTSPKSIDLNEEYEEEDTDDWFS